MAQLPAPIWGEVLRHLPLQQQPAIRRTSRVFATQAVPLEQCCTLPTNRELLHWLLGQQQLLAYPSSHKFDSLSTSSGYRNKFDSLQYLPEDTIVVRDIRVNASVMPGGQRLDDIVQISIRAGNPMIIGDGVLKTLSTVDLVRLLDNDTPLMVADNKSNVGFQNIWVIIRDLLHLRIGCVNRGWDADRCYLQLLTQYLAPVYASVVYLHYILLGATILLRLLMPEASRRLLQDMQQVYDVYRGGSNDTIYHFGPMDAAEYVRWIKEWMTILTPDDLAPVGRNPLVWPM